jgi:hypothetical protein
MGGGAVMSVSAASENTDHNPSPDPMAVKLFHLYSDVDTEASSQHHTLGAGNNQAAAGSHVHNGSDSPLLFEGVIISGAKGSNTALASVISLLTQQGAVDQTTA